MRRMYFNGRGFTQHHFSFRLETNPIMRHSMKSGAGFTLMEILISASIFGIALVIAVGLFTSVLTAQRRVQVMTKLQGDTRYLMEVMAQEIRINGIDYSWYTNGRENGWFYFLESRGSFDVYGKLYYRGDTIAEIPVRELVTKDASGIRRVYRLFEKEWLSGEYLIALCTQDTKSTDLDEAEKCRWGKGAQPGPDDVFSKRLDTNFRKITPDNISVDVFNIWIKPGSDPYEASPSSRMDCRRERVNNPTVLDPVTGLPASGFDESKGVCACYNASADCRSEECVGAITDSTQPFTTWTQGFCINPNEQPRATITMTSRNVDVPENQQQSTTLQTTISSRIYKR